MSGNLYKDKTDIVIKFEFDIGETIQISASGIHGIVIMLGFDGQPHYKISWHDGSKFRKTWFPEWRLEKVEQHVEEDYERLKPSMTVPLSK